MSDIMIQYFHNYYWDLALSGKVSLTIKQFYLL